MTATATNPPVPGLVERGGCPLCRDRRCKPEHSFKDVPVVRCTGCGFLYSSRVMSVAALAAYYANQITNERLQQGQEVFAQASVAALERITPLNRLTHVLDVGAGYGFLLSRIHSRHGIRGIGVEPSDVESLYGRDHLNVDVRTAVLADAGLDRQAFDLVCAFEVIEHTLDPEAFIAELADYVTPGGYLVIGTDNFKSRAVRSLGPAFPKWIPHTHISHFCPDSLIGLLKRLPGFTVAGYTSYTPWEFHARRLVATLRRPVAIEDVYDLRAELTREVSRGFKLYRLRRTVTPIWFRATASSTLSGEMMYIALRRQP